MITVPPDSPHDQKVVGLATDILAFVEAASPMAGPGREGDEGTEALVAALIRRVGPFAYTGLAEWIPLSKA